MLASDVSHVGLVARYTKLGGKLRSGGKATVHRARRRLIGDIVAINTRIRTISDISGISTGKETFQSSNDMAFCCERVAASAERTRKETRCFSRMLRTNP